ncbi:bifunctional adenosylcobinamide kinase/adenosylcobinamide-phosphate guanylyltransferase [Rhodoferax sp.]|uniref:bifunctional adenosylcobinamide kinase/adenosylcobinamide-phosphate guanylyltransferase n=1 Tax=Rhodoferax sp. TaxID=50421 RepID=UPI0027452479|nr:bifunctional adenosylcobinamide kinase/adenosylcobinamide-phosphate guanylyltransferase [Rhodoferax sp.]
MPDIHLKVARGELILGGQKSGKSRRAEALAQSWLKASKTHHAVLLVTARAGDDEMRQRIERHQTDRARRLAGLTTVEEPLALAESIQAYSRAQTLVLVDCLTLWLTNQLMPVAPQAPAGDVSQPGIRIAALALALQSAPGPVVLVSNEIGLGVVPMGCEVRGFVDALGQLNQAVAAVCERVTLMVAGLPMILKEPTWRKS